MKRVYGTAVRTSLIGFLLVIVSVACASSSQPPLLVDITTVGDTVALQHSLDDTFFHITAVVHNRDSRPIALVGCFGSPDAERETNGKWTIVFSPGCIADYFRPIAAGDSAVFPLTIWGYTGKGHYPELVSPAVPGNYRLVFSVAITQSPVPPTSAPASQKVRSAVFVLQ
jgi:hypothetical protein